MASSVRWVLPFTASLSLLAAPGDAPQTRCGWPWEVQLSLDQMGYANHDVTGPSGTFKMGADSKVNLGGRATIDLIPLPFGSLQFSAGYRLGNDVPLNYGPKAPVNLKHEGQIQAGLMLRFAATRNLEFGLGLDERHDDMRATGAVGSPTEYNAWRPWVRGMARYMFDRGTCTTPFVGLEAAYALSDVKIDSQNYYQDYTVLTGDYPAGYRTRVQGPDSFTRGHFPTWQVALVGGVRFGRFNKNAAPVAAPAPLPAPEPAPVAPAPEPKPAEAPAPEAAKPLPTETPKAPETIEIEGLVVRFPLNKAKRSQAATDLVKGWVQKYKAVVDANAVTVTGHCDKTGSHAYNQRLSERRAKAVAAFLKEEGMAIEDANVTGKSFDEPAYDNDTNIGRAKNRRTEVGVKEGTHFKVTSKQETPYILPHTHKAKAEKPAEAPEAAPKK